MRRPAWIEELAGLGEPRGMQQWLEALPDRAAPHVAVRAAAAAAATVVALWDEVLPGHSLLRGNLEVARRWIACPCERHASACLALARRFGPKPLPAEPFSIVVDGIELDEARELAFWSVDDTLQAAGHGFYTPPLAAEQARDAIACAVEAKCASRSESRQDAVRAVAAAIAAELGDVEELGAPARAAPRQGSWASADPPEAAVVVRALPAIASILRASAGAAFEERVEWAAIRDGSRAVHRWSSADLAVTLTVEVEAYMGVERQWSLEIVGPLGRVVVNSRDGAALEVHAPASEQERVRAGLTEVLRSF